MGRTDLKNGSTAVTTRFLNYINKKMDALKDVFVAAQIVSLLIFAAVRSDWKKHSLHFLVLRHTTVNDNESSKH